MSMQGPQAIPVLKEKYEDGEMKEFVDLIKRLNSNIDKTKLEAQLEYAKMPTPKKEKFKEFRQDLALVQKNNKAIEARQAEVAASRAELERKKQEQAERKEDLEGKRVKLSQNLADLSACRSNIASLQAENAALSVQRDVVFNGAAGGLVTQFKGLKVSPSNGTSPTSNARGLAPAATSAACRK